jgi:predicted transcriptional regulator
MSSDPQMLEALNHSLRRCILRAVEAEGGETGALELSRTLGSPIGEIAYQLSVLVRAGALEATRIERRRGASRQLYRLSPHGRAEWVRGALEAFRQSDDAARA